MENNYILEKIYSIPAAMFREGFRAYQKKFVYPKSYVIIAIFLVLCANFVYGAVKAPDSYMAYILIVACLAMAFREWYNPRKMRMEIMDVMNEMEKNEYRLAIGEGFIEISTIEHGNVENLVENQENGEEFSTIEQGEVENSVEEEIPPTIINIGGDTQILEYEGFFLIIDGKAMFYVVPKNDFSDSEQDILRNLIKK